MPNNNNATKSLFDDPEQQEKLIAAMEKQIRTMDTIERFVKWSFVVLVVAVLALTVYGYRKGHDRNDDRKAGNDDRHPEVFVLSLGQFDHGIF